MIIYFIYKEVLFYLEPRLIFKFKPDTDLETKLKINIDLTIAMPCRGIGADILDSTNQNVFSFGVLEEEDTWWELCPNQQMYFEYMQQLNTYLREEYHSIAVRRCLCFQKFYIGPNILFKYNFQEVLYKGDEKMTYKLPPRSKIPDKPYDACRVHGKLTLNKVAGNFHITAGKSIHFPSGHIHLSAIFEEHKQNFSHRINRFSFGDSTAGIIHPLEGDEKILTDSNFIVLLDF